MVLNKKFSIISVLLILTLSFSLTPSSAPLADEFRFSPRPNRAYLINWRTWSRAAFEEARKSNRLILLSLSAVWCHWCHVMDETTYSNPEVIEFINKNFIPIRVDADRRPDIDGLYNQGGWPSTVVLTPDGEILNGGTYIPPVRMLEMLKGTLEFYRNNKEHIKQRIIGLQKLKKEKNQPEEKTEEDYVVVENIFKSLEENFDERYGGFDIGQKFPRPEVLEFLMIYYLIKPKKWVKKMILQSLDAMAMSRLYDHVEGGFFRYSVKRDWSAPHFEKMLDVNSALLKDYVIAYRLFNKRKYIEIARGVYDYLTGHLYDKDTGLFYGSQDADESYYNRNDRNALTTPSIDKTFYADKNAIALSALTKYAGLVGDKRAKVIATGLAKALIDHFYKKGEGVFHYRTKQKNATLSGLLKDNVMVSMALLDIYELTGNSRFLNTSKEIASFIQSRFLHKGILNESINTQIVTPSTSGLFRKYSLIRNNYHSLILFARLMHYDKSFKESYNILKKRAGSYYKRLYFTSSLLGIALEYVMNKPYRVEIVTTQKGTEGLLKSINKIFMPFKTVEILLIGRDHEKIKQKGYAEKEAIYICKGKKCFKPVIISKNMDVQLNRIFRTYSLQ